MWNTRVGEQAEQILPSDEVQVGVSKQNLRFLKFSPRSAVPSVNDESLYQSTFSYRAFNRLRVRLPTISRGCDAPMLKLELIAQRRLGALLCHHAIVSTRTIFGLDDDQNIAHPQNDVGLRECEFRPEPAI